MLQAIKDGHLITWTGLTEDDINNEPAAPEHTINLEGAN
jgi:hypothetical protein